MMRRTWMARLNALILGLLLAGGGSGLPVVDVLLHHLRGNVRLASSFLSDPAQAGTHAERCTLGAPLPILSSSATQRPAEHLGLLPCRTPALREPVAPVTAERRSPSLARAPPTTLA